ncbi:MAG: aminotransferase class III-fold pyridoxal phosphate-dependent enzyme [Bacteroidota bacterium]
MCGAIRDSFEGGAGYYSIEPDLVTYGKIIGGGLPVGAFGGKAEIMGHISPEGPVYQAGTLSANPVAMTAGYTCLEILLEEGFYDHLEHKAASFVGRISGHIHQKSYPMHMVRCGSIFWMAFGEERIIKASDIDPASMDHFKKLHRYLLDHGVYLGPSGYEVGFISASHSQKTLDKAVSIICDGIDATFT